MQEGRQALILLNDELNRRQSPRRQITIAHIPPRQVCTASTFTKPTTPNSALKCNGPMAPASLTTSDRRRMTSALQTTPLTVESSSSRQRADQPAPATTRPERTSHAAPISNGPIRILSTVRLHRYVRRTYPGTWIPLLSTRQKTYTISMESGGSHTTSSTSSSTRTRHSSL